MTCCDNVGALDQRNDKFFGTGNQTRQQRQSFEKNQTEFLQKLHLGILSEPALFSKPFQTKSQTCGRTYQHEARYKQLKTLACGTLVVEADRGYIQSFQVNLTSFCFCCGFMGFVFTCPPAHGPGSSTLQNHRPCQYGDFGLSGFPAICGKSTQQSNSSKGASKYH